MAVKVGNSWVSEESILSKQKSEILWIYHRSKRGSQCMEYIRKE